MPSNIRIDELHLRVPGLSRYQATHLGMTVAQQLARQLPGIARSGTLSELRVRLTIPSGTPQARLGFVIATGIVKKIS
jgi:hypothetical protein